MNKSFEKGASLVALIVLVALMAFVIFKLTSPSSDSGYQNPSTEESAEILNRTKDVAADLRARDSEILKEL